MVKHWPEIFKDINVKTIPIEYLHSVHVTFDDGKVWAIELDKNQGATPEEMEFGLEELLDQYEDQIVNLDFRINTHKVKYDIQQRTKHFMKKRK